MFFPVLYQSDGELRRWSCLCEETSTQGLDLKSRVNTHLYVANGEDHRVGQVDFVGVLVDGGRDDGRVDDDRVVGGRGLAAQLHAGVLRGEVDPDVFVEDEGDPDLTCRVTGEGETVRRSVTGDSGTPTPLLFTLTQATLSTSPLPRSI